MSAIVSSPVPVILALNSVSAVNAETVQHVTVHKEEPAVILLEEVKIRLSSKLGWGERTLTEGHRAIGKPSHFGAN